MHGLNHVHRRGAIYVWRRRLPKVLGENRFLQVSLRTSNFFSANCLAALVNEKFVTSVREMKAQRISSAEAQRFLAAEVANALKQIEEDRYFEPEATSPDEWRARYFQEKCRAVALRIVAARGRGACLIEEDRNNLAANGFTEQQLENIDLEIEALRSEVGTPEFAQDVLKTASDVFDRNDLSEHDIRASGALKFQARAIALENSNRRNSVGPFVALNEVGCLELWASDRERSTSPAAVSELDTVRSAAQTNAEQSNSPTVLIQQDSHDVERKDRIDDLISRYLAHIDKKSKCAAETKKIAKDVRQRTSVLRHFSQAISSQNLLDLRQSDLSLFDEAMDSIPKIHGKSLKDRKRSIHELIERGEDLPEEEVGLAAGTKNRNWGIVKGLLTFARAKHGMVPRSQLFFEDLYAVPKDGEENVRLAFTDNDVRQLTVHPVWRDGRCPARGCDGRKFENFGLYWLPIIADLTGARREEIAGMKLSEVVTDTRIPYFDFRLNENRRLKNKSSQRCVPIHEVIQRLGFFDYVSSLRDAGQTDLFPDLKPASAGSFGGVFYKSWKPLLDDQLGSDLVGKVFHSWRHRFISLLRSDADIPKDIVQDIVGHAPVDETDRTYRDRDTPQFRDALLERLNPAIQSVPAEHWLGQGSNG